MRDIKLLWSDCTRVENKRPDCKEIFPMLHRYMKDFQWPSVVSEYFRRYLVPVRVAYQTMMLLMFDVMTKKPWVSTLKEAVDWFRTIKEEYADAGKYFTNFGEKIHEERSWDFGVPEVCEVRRYMWKDFEQPACEKRWIKNKVSDGASKKTRRAVDTSEDDGDSDFDDDDDSGDGDSKDDEFFNTFANVDDEKMITIGGFASEFELIVKSRFEDISAGKEYVVDKRELNLHTTSKGEVIEELIDEAYEKRNDLTKKKVKEMDVYMNKTYFKLRDAEKAFLDQLEKQILKWNKRIKVA